MQGLKEEAEAAKAQQAAATQQVNYKGQLAKSEQGRADVVEQCITARKRNIVLGQQVADTKAAVNTLQVPVMYITNQQRSCVCIAVLGNTVCMLSVHCMGPD